MNFRKSKILRNLAPNTPASWMSSTDRVNIDVSSSPTLQHQENIVNMVDYVLTVLSGLLIISSFLLSMVEYDNDYVDVCLVDRFEKDQMVSNAIYLKKTFLFPSFLVLTLFGIIITLIYSYKKQYSPSNHCRNWKEALRAILQLSSWYYCSYSVVMFLKLYIGDHNCNVHPNSVSGHYNFILYSLFAFYLLLKMIGWNDWKATAFYYLYVFVGVAIMLDTFVFGYHTVRQCIYGAALALVSVYSIAKVMIIARKQNFSLLVLLLTISFLSLSFITRYSWESYNLVDEKSEKRSMFNVYLPGIVSIGILLLSESYVNNSTEKPSNH